MREDIIRTIMDNFNDLGNSVFVDVAIRPVSTNKWSGYRVFNNGSSYEIELHDRNKFRFWHEIKDLLARNIAIANSRAL